MPVLGAKGLFHTCDAAREHENAFTKAVRSSKHASKAELRRPTALMRVPSVYAATPQRSCSVSSQRTMPSIRRANSVFAGGRPEFGVPSQLGAVDALVTNFAERKPISMSFPLTSLLPIRSGSIRLGVSQGTQPTRPPRRNGGSDCGIPTTGHSERSTICRGRGYEPSDVRRRSHQSRPSGCSLVLCHSRIKRGT